MALRHLGNDLGSVGYAEVSRSDRLRDVLQLLVHFDRAVLTLGPLRAEAVRALGSFVTLALETVVDGGLVAGRPRLLGPLSRVALGFVFGYATASQVRAQRREGLVGLAFVLLLLLFAR